MLPLKTTLIVNGVSSGVTGALMIMFPKLLAQLFGAGTTTAFVGTGVFLVMFAALVLVTAFKRDVSARLVRVITTLDTLWVIGSVILIVLGFSVISAIGLVLIAAVALWVAAMAYLQAKGIAEVGGRSARVIMSVAVVVILSNGQVQGQQMAYSEMRSNPTTEVTNTEGEESLITVTNFLQAVKEKSHAKALPLLDSLVQWHQPGNNRFSGIKNNAEEVFDMFRGFLDMTAGTLQLKESEVLVVNGNTVACRLHWTAVTPPGSILDVENVDVYTVANGKIVKAVIYSSDIEQENRFWWK